MKSLRWAIMVLLAASVQPAYADSIPVFNISRATISFSANTQAGDNSQFVFAGPGVSIMGGGSACGGSDEWCNGAFLPPGTSVTPNVGLVSFDFVSVKIGGHTYTSPSAALFNSSITAGNSFTLPMGKNSPFTLIVTIPASLASPRRRPSRWEPIQPEHSSGQAHADVRFLSQRGRLSCRVLRFY